MRPPQRPNPKPPCGKPEGRSHLRATPNERRWWLAFLFGIAVGMLLAGVLLGAFA